MGAVKMTHVVTVGRGQFPAGLLGEWLVADLRMVGGFDPEALRRAGVPEELVAAAAESDPPGFAAVGTRAGEARRAAARAYARGLLSVEERGALAAEHGIGAEELEAAMAHHGLPEVACPACGTDSSVGCINGIDPPREE